VRKIVFFLISLTIIFSILYFVLKEKINIENISQSIKRDTGLSVNLQNNHKWSYYPNIVYQNNLSITNNSGDLISEKGQINVVRDYKINAPFIINYQSPSILYKGINFRNAQIESEYYNKIINLKKFTANVIEGKINLNGDFYLKDNKEIYLNGSYNNISINRILKQLKITNWDRVQIKLSSSDFSINTIANTSPEIIENLNGKMKITGSIFFVSTEEERFSAAFLSLLADKFINIKPLSKSISYLLDKFADQPSNIYGILNINEGILTTEKLLINNIKEKALLTGSLNLSSNSIDAKIDLYENDVIFLTAELKGNLENPKILIGGQIFSKDVISKPQNIKEIFEKGIQTLVDDILNLND